MCRTKADPDGADKEERLAGALGRFWRDRGYRPLDLIRST